MTATVLFGGVFHETTTFDEEVTDRSDFRATWEYEGEAAIAELPGTDSVIGGAIDVAEDRGIVLVHPRDAPEVPHRRRGRRRVPGLVASTGEHCRMS